MVIARLVFALLALAAVIAFAGHAVTGDARYRRWGVRIVSAGVLAGLVFFALLAVERLVTRA